MLAKGYFQIQNPRLESEYPANICWISSQAEFFKEIFFYAFVMIQNYYVEPQNYKF